MAAARASLHPVVSRNRRRSSARFLHLNNGARGRDSLQSVQTSSGGAGTATETPANLSELYQKAIRMNAENKINAGNSWNLRLIENIDLFLGNNDDNDCINNISDNGSSPTTNSTRVNFTKASCTLDASVKIYGYRVDDVHLTSYKVLANLNRSSNCKDSNEKDPSGGGSAEDEDDGAAKKMESRNKSNNHGSTLETHIGTCWHQNSRVATSFRSLFNHVITLAIQICFKPISI